MTSLDYGDDLHGLITGRLAEMSVTSEMLASVEDLSGVLHNLAMRAKAVTAADFAAKVDLRGAEIVQQARSGPCRTTPDLPGFFEQMDRSGPWTPVPLRMILSQPGGPVDQPFFDAFLAEIDDLYERPGL